MVTTSLMLIQQAVLCLLGTAIVFSRGGQTLCTLGKKPEMFGSGSVTSSGLFLNTQAPVQCSGVVTSWSFCYYVMLGGERELYFGVWRHNGSGVYNHIGGSTWEPIEGVLIPSFEFICQVLDLSDDQQFPVQQNDVIGVYVSTSAHIHVVGTISENSLYHQAISLNTTNLQFDQQASFSNGSYEEGYGLFLEATVDDLSGSGAVTEDILLPSPSTPSMVTTSTPLSKSGSDSQIEETNEVLPLWAILVIALLVLIVMSLTLVLIATRCSGSRQLQGRGKPMLLVGLGMPMKKRLTKASTKNASAPVLLELNIEPTDLSDGTGRVTVITNPANEPQTVVSESNMASGGGNTEMFANRTQVDPHKNTPPSKLRTLPKRTPTNISLPDKPPLPSSPMILSPPLFRCLRTSKSESELFLLDVLPVDHQDFDPIHHYSSVTRARRSRSLGSLDNVYAAVGGDAIYDVPVPQEYLEFAPVYSYACTDRVVKLPKSATQSKELGPASAYLVLPPPVQNTHRPPRHIVAGTSGQVALSGPHDYDEITSPLGHSKFNRIHGKVETRNGDDPVTINLEESRVKSSHQRNKLQSIKFQNPSFPITISLHKKTETDSQSPPQTSELELSTASSGYVNDDDGPEISTVHARERLQEDNHNRTARMPYHLAENGEMMTFKRADSLKQDRRDSLEQDRRVSRQCYTPLLESMRNDSEDLLYDLPIINLSSRTFPEADDTSGDYDHLGVNRPDYDTIES